MQLYEVHYTLYQFAIQYSDVGGNELTSYYSVTNPLPIADEFKTTVNFNYTVGKSIVVGVSNLDLTGQFQYFNLAVIKTINNVSSVELIGTYNIEESSKEITYTGADKTPIQLSTLDIFEKFPYYDIADDVTAVQDVIVWKDLTSIDRTNYQSIASNINLKWETYRIPPGEDYSDELNATNLRGYMRDEVYAFEIVFLLKNGKQTDGFHIPGRTSDIADLVAVGEKNNDFIGEPDYMIGIEGFSPYWKIYNTGSLIGPSNEQSSDSDYKGPWEYGNFAYWESTEEYPCNDDVWGDLAGEKIRHHKFPDVLVSPIIENGDLEIEQVVVGCRSSRVINTSTTNEIFNYKYVSCQGSDVVEGSVPPGEIIEVCHQEDTLQKVSGDGFFTQAPIFSDYCDSDFGTADRIKPEMRDDAVFPIGVRLDNNEINSLIASSSLTSDQKADVEAYIEATAKRSERDRMADVKTISGVFTGAYVEHPFTKEQVPIWIGDYVLAGYGTGAVMSVPCGDQRDYAFAKHFNIPLVEGFSTTAIIEKMNG